MVHPALWLALGLLIGVVVSRTPERSFSDDLQRMAEEAFALVGLFVLVGGVVAIPVVLLLAVADVDLELTGQQQWFGGLLLTIIVVAILMERDLQKKRQRRP